MVGRDTRQHGVRKTATPVLRPVVRCSPRQGAVHNWQRDGHRGSLRGSSLRPSTSEDGQRQEKRLIMTTRPIPRDFRKETKSGFTARPGPEESHPSSSRSGKAYTRWSPVQGGGLPDQATSQGEDDGGTTGQTGATQSDYLGREVL
jgi:hypothetical protein